MSGGQQRREGGVEEGFVGQQNGVGEDDPEKCRDGGRGCAACPPGRVIKGHTGKGGAEHIETGGRDERGQGVGAEDPENAGQQQGINGSHPGGRTRFHPERRTETVAGRHGVSDVARLEEERNYCQCARRVLGDVEPEESKPHQECRNDEGGKGDQAAQGLVYRSGRSTAGFVIGWF